MRREPTPSTVSAHRKRSIYFDSIILLCWPGRCWPLSYWVSKTYCVTLCKWVYLSESQCSHLCLTEVFWSPCRFCLISGGSWRKEKGQGLSLQPVRHPSICLLTLHLCALPHLNQVFWVFRKRLPTTGEVKSPCRSIFFRAGAHGSSCPQTDMGCRPRGHTRPCCSFSGQPCTPAGFPPLQCSSPHHARCHPPHSLQDAFFDSWGHETHFSPIPRNACSLLFIPLSYLLLESFIGMFYILDLIISLRRAEVYSEDICGCDQ